MGERDTGRRRSPQCGGHARHHGDREARGAQRLDFLAATAEHEGIAGLQPDDGLPSLHATHQLGVDFRLRPARTAFPLADRDSLGVSPGAVEHRRRHEVVVQDHVSLAQELRGLQGQQVGIARAGADDMGHTHRRDRTAGGIQLAQHRAPGTGIVAGQRQPCGRSIDQATPEGAAPRRIDDQRIDLCPEGRGQPRHRADALGQHRLDAVAQQGRQRGRRAAGRDRHHDAVAVDDRRQDEITKGRPVGHVHRHAGRAGSLLSDGVAVEVIGRDEYCSCTLKISGLDPAKLAHESAGRAGQGRSPIGGRPLADHDDRAVLEVEEQRQVLHSTATRRST